MKTIILILTMCLASLAYAIEEGGHSGNGGGGVKRNGLYMTFYSAGFYTEPTESEPDEVPQLNTLLRFLNSNKFLTSKMKANYLASILPTPERRYFKVQPDTFTEEVRARLMAEYSRVMKLPTNEVALFAITDTSAKITYLLPEFYTLKPNEQMAILFHEAYWILNPSSDYQHVIQAEMSLQAYLDKPKSTERLIRWLESISSDFADALNAYIRIDIENKALDGLLHDNKINLDDLLGKDYFECALAGNGSVCKSHVQINLYELTQKHPRSFLLKVFNQTSAKNVFDLLSTDYFSRSVFSHDSSDKDFFRFVKSGYLKIDHFLYQGTSSIRIFFDIDEQKRVDCGASYICKSKYILFDYVIKLI